MNLQTCLLMSASLSALTGMAQASHSTLASEGVLESVIITANRIAPTSLPTQIPTTMEGTTQEKIEATVNATDSEDAIKYFPSLLVRKRYVGDFNHAVLSSRASGTGNSARSAVYADGILISNYLGNGATYAPRWMLVTPEQIERVDVMYGPFSAAYPGNSAGAIVDYVTRMPEKLEAHAKVSYFVQPSFDLYNTHQSFSGHQLSASVGDRSGDFSWWFNVDHLRSHGQPLTFSTKLLSAGTASPLTGEKTVSGAVLDKDRSNNPQYIIGTGTEYDTIQDHAKFKLAYDITPTLRASYLLGYWRNDAINRPQTYLRDTSGAAVYSGNININGLRYALAVTDYPASNETFAHVMHGLSVKSHTESTWDWEAATSLYNFNKDQIRQPTIVFPTALGGGTGTLTDQNGTGWNTLAFKGVWRPQGLQGAHIVDFGVQQDSYKLRILKYNTTGNWLNDAGTTFVSDVGGKTRTEAVYAQDAWHFAEQWKTVLGVRIEQWHATGGYTHANSSGSCTSVTCSDYASRNTTYASPKAALAYQLNSDSAVKFSLGRAVRMPTVSELYGATSGGSVTVINDPNLRPEKSWTSELSWESHFNATQLRVTGFYELVKDSLYSERIAVGNTIVSRVTNVGKIATSGIETSIVSQDVLRQGLELSGSVTYANSRIKENNGYVITPGDTINKRQPRVPEWRATGLASYRINEQWNVSLGARYSDPQYSTLDNSDPNGFAYQGASKYFTMDARVLYRFAQHWSAALGIDNLNNDKYWNFHPYPQRTFMAEMKWDW